MLILLFLSFFKFIFYYLWFWCVPSYKFLDASSQLSTRISTIFSLPITKSNAKWRAPIKSMWYLRKIESSCEQFSQVSTCLWQKYIKFCFHNLGNVKGKNRCRWTTFGFNNKKKNFGIFCYNTTFFHFRNQK